MEIQRVRSLLFKELKENEKNRKTINMEYENYNEQQQTDW